MTNVDRFRILWLARVLGRLQRLAKIRLISPDQHGMLSRHVVAEYSEERTIVMTTEPNGTFREWAILELMGHVRMAGIVTEEELFGTKMGRIDVPTGDDSFVTFYFGGSSVYRLTPTTEVIARHIARSNQPAPVSRWELPAPTGQPDDESYDEDEPFDRDGED